MTLSIPLPSLVVLIGPSGSGKSTFAARHFLPTEVISSDACRGLVADDPSDQGATDDAFELVRFLAGKRLARGRLTVIDATNVQPENRKPYVTLARQFDTLPVAIVFNLPRKLCEERTRARPDRHFGPRVVANQASQLRRSLRSLGREGFRHVHVFGTAEEVDSAAVVRTRLWCDRRDDRGPFDVIGDVHGCYDELVLLLGKLGYVVGPDHLVSPPEGRKAIFLGDLVDRGPRSMDVLRLVMGMVERGSASSIPGNHDTKLLKKLRGRDVRVSHGLAQTLEELDREPPEFREKVVRFLDSLVSHYVLDEGRLVVAHAGMREELQGRASSRVRDFALYGETTGETDEFGLPVRLDWAAEYRGRAIVVYGHTPVLEPQWLNRTINIDTGCAFGGKLTALRYPEKELVSVPAARVYFEPARPLATGPAAGLTLQQREDDLLDADDVLGRRAVETRLRDRIAIREDQAAAALEAMSRFAADPKWLVHLPPTMSPCETSSRPGFLERPAEALDYYRHQGLSRVVCEEKHMGSRAIVAICHDEEAARTRFGVRGDGPGITYTRTGRPFFDDTALAAAFLDRVREAIEKAGLWRDLDTDWLLLDAEILPWSAKARELLREQYAAVGAAASAALPDAIATLELAATRALDVSLHLERLRAREENARRFVTAYRHYCWPVGSLADLRLAPFHILASEGRVHADRDHLWHLSTLGRLANTDPAFFLATDHRVVDLADPASEATAIAWWEEMTSRGGEGMVVKPFEFVARGKRGLVQPAVKCRGPEYLRIIYGPDYTLPENLERLRHRGLGRKRSLALREFVLGIEALERFVRREPLRRVHECVFGVLALESEPVDPRL